MLDCRQTCYLVAGLESAVSVSKVGFDVLDFVFADLKLVQNACELQSVNGP